VGPQNRQNAEEDGRGSPPGITEGSDPTENDKDGEHRLVVWSTNVDIMTNDKLSELTSLVQQEEPDVIAL
jgi:hypothetical protein